MMKCDNCAKRESCRIRMEAIKRMPSVNIAYCTHFKEVEPTPPITNGDKIRAMTDEELCDFILDKRENGHCFNDRCYHNDPNKGCDYCTLEWLKQEADHADTD